MRISVAPQRAALQLTVAMTTAAAKSVAPGAFSQVLSTNLSGVSGQAPLPSTLKLGFGASTGTATNYMDVRNINVRAFTDAQITQQLSASTPGHAGLAAGTFVPGDTVAFEATATNNGPTTIGSAPNGVAVVLDDLSALPLEDVAWTCTATGGASCLTGGGTGSVVSEEWTGPAGSSVTVVIQGTVETTVSAGTYTSTAVIPTDFDSMTVVAGQDTVQRDGGAADTDLSNNSSDVEFDIALVPDADSSTIAAQPTSITTDGDSTITVSLVDVNGNALATGGADVTMTTDLGELGAVTDNGDGTYSATLSGHGAAGTATIGFAVDGVPGTAVATVVISAGMADAVSSTITASPSSILTDGESTVTVTTFDASGNRIVTGGSTVTMTTDIGTLGAVTDNGDGTYTATLFGDSAAGTATIGFAVDDATSTSTASVEISAASASVSTITASPSSIVADGASTSLITVTLRDVSGEPLTTGGQDVAIEILPGVQVATAGQSRVMMPAVDIAAAEVPTLTETTDNGDGTYTATLTSPTQIGTAVLGFTVDGMAAQSTAVVTFTPVPPVLVPTDPDTSVTVVPAPAPAPAPAVLASTGSNANATIALLAVALGVVGIVLTAGARRARIATGRASRS